MRSVNRRWNLSAAKHQQGVKTPDALLKERVDLLRKELGDGNTAQDVIKELDGLAAKARHGASLVVALENGTGTTRIIPAKDENRLAEVEELIRAGGDPVGFIVDNMIFVRKPYLQYLQAGLADYLTDVAKEFFSLKDAA